MNARDFAQYFLGTVLCNKEFGFLAEVINVAAEDDGDTSPFSVRLQKLALPNPESYAVRYDDTQFWNLWEKINPPLGYVNHYRKVAVFLSMSPSRQYQKSLSLQRLNIFVPNKSVVNTCKIKISTDYNLLIPLFEDLKNTYTSSVLELLNGDALGISLSRKLAICSNKDSLTPDLYYRKTKIGTCDLRSIKLFPEMAEYKDYVKKITSVEDIVC